MKYVLGIDPALNGCGVAIVDEELDHHCKRISMASKGTHVRARVKRFERLTHRIFEFIETIKGEEPPQAIFMEGYSLGSNQAHVRTGAEFRGILLADLAHWPDVPIFDNVAPGTLKKFISGKGDADKEDIVNACLNRYWAVGLGSHDEADAYGLARMAAIYVGWDECKDIKQQEAMKTVTKKTFAIEGVATLPFPEEPVKPF